MQIQGPSGVKATIPRCLSPKLYFIWSCHRWRSKSSYATIRLLTGTTGARIAKGSLCLLPFPGYLEPWPHFWRAWTMVTDQEPSIFLICYTWTCARQKKRKILIKGLPWNPAVMISQNCTLVSLFENIFLLFTLCVQFDIVTFLHILSYSK